MDLVCIEDNEDFSFFLTKAFHSYKQSSEKYQNDLKISMYEGGKPFLDELINKSGSSNVPKLIFLDINLPDIGGMDILKTIKESQKLKRIPVVMLSSSEHPQDISDAYNLGANAYLVKPSGFKNIKTMINSACEFWLGHNYSYA